MEGGGGERDDAADPFAGLNLDEEFVRGAQVREPSAWSRQRIHGVVDDHRRLQQEWADELRSLRRARRRARVVRKGVALVVLVGLTAGVWLRIRSTAPAQAPSATPPADVATSQVVSLEGGVPPPSPEEQPHPLGEPPPLPEGGGAYQFLMRQQGSDEPVAYEPCRPLHLVVNSRTAPPEGDQLLAEALAGIGRSTGLQLIFDGPTDEPPDARRAPYQPQRYGERWAPVLVAWSDPGEQPRLAGRTAGLGGSTAVRSSAENLEVYVSGGVVLDGPQLGRMLEERGGAAQVRSVILHELGHLVGLGHVDDESQVMHHGGNVTEFGAGDLTGLALLGRGRCARSI